MIDQEFKFLGNTMENITIKYGIFLIVWGVGVSWLSQSESFTSWIPTMLGLPILLFGWLSHVNPKRKKLFMHFAVLFGLVAFLGGLDFLRELGSERGPFLNLYASLSKLVLLLSGAIFCYICIKSFRFARINSN